LAKFPCGVPYGYQGLPTLTDFECDWQAIELASLEGDTPMTYRDYITSELRAAFDRALYWVRYLFIYFVRKVTSNG